MTASIRERPEWARLLGNYDPVVDVRHRWGATREDVERFLASLTSEELDELVRIVQTGGAEEPLAHDVLVVLSRRFDARLGSESLEAWRRVVFDQVWACRKQGPVMGPSGGMIDRSFRFASEARVPISGRGMLLVGPGDVRCEVTFTPVGMDPDGHAVELPPELDSDNSDGLGIRINLADDGGRIHAVTAARSASRLWERLGNQWGFPFLKSAYQPLVSGLRCHDDSRTVVLATGYMGNVRFPQEEFLKYRLYTLDVCDGASSPGTPGLAFVIRPHWGRDGVTPPYVLSAEGIPHDVLASWSNQYNPWRPVVESADARGQPQASVRFHASS